MSDYQENRVSLVGAPIQEGAGRPGCAMGPAAFRVAGIEAALSDLGLKVLDLGDVERRRLVCSVPERDGLKALSDIVGWTQALAEKSYRLGMSNSFPIYLGGDHSLSLGTLTGHARAAKERGRPLFVLWLDAHADFNTFETTQSGNIHGTPLAFGCGVSGFCSMLETERHAVIDPRNVCIVGLRSVDPDERRLLTDRNVTVHDMRAIDENGIARLVEAFLERVAAANGLLHVSLDVDFLDPEIAPAVGTCVPGGITYREAHLVMELIHDSGLATSLDLAELNPFLDERGRTAHLMVDLTTSLFGRRIMDRPTRSHN